MERRGWGGEGGEERVERRGWRGEGGEERVERRGWGGEGGNNYIYLLGTEQESAYCIETSTRSQTNLMIHHIYVRKFTSDLLPTCMKTLRPT